MTELTNETDFERTRREVGIGVSILEPELRRLRAIEAAARTILTFLPGGPNAALPSGPFLEASAALRKALR